MGEHKAKGYPSRFMVAQTPPGDVIIDTVPTQVRLDFEIEDTLGEFDELATYRFSPIRAGRYLLHGQVGLQIIPLTCNVVLEIRSLLAGPIFTGVCYSSPSEVNISQVTSFYYMEPGDYLELWITEWCAGNPTIDPAANVTFFQGHRIS